MLLGTGTADQGNAAHISYFGGKDGSAYYSARWKDGVVIAGLNVWYATGKFDRIEALQAIHSDGQTGPFYGQDQSGELVTTVRWDSSNDMVTQLIL